MTSQIKIPLRELTEQTIKDLQEKYPNAEVRLDVHTDNEKLILSEDEFWKTINLIDWQQENDDDKLKPLINSLQKKSIRKIYDFADLLSKYLYRLDTKKFAQQIGIDAWKDDGQYFSVDNFLYARLCVIANGEEFYNNVLNNPAKMPKNLAFEDLLYAPAEAYQNKTNKALDYTPRFPIETYSNKEGWN